MKKYITILAILVLSFVSNAQSIANFSIDSGGLIITNSSIKMIYTIGEVNVQESGIGNISLSEGFINGNIVSSTLAVDDEVLTDVITIFPNPVSNIVNINSIIPIENVEFYDVLGKKVLTTKETAQIQIDHLTTGVYMLKVTTEQGLLVKKLIVQ